MTWTYELNPSGSNLDAVRLMTGDTDITEPILQDEEINYFLTNNANVYFAAWRACYAAAAKFAREANKAVGQLHIDLSNVAKNYRLQGDSWQMQGLSGAFVYAGGLSIADKESSEQNPDRVPPLFTRDLFRAPGAILPTVDSSDLVPANDEGNT